MKFAKPVALVVGVIVVGAVTVTLFVSNAQSKEAAERMQALDRMEALQRSAEAAQEHALDVQERAAALAERSRTSR